MGARRWYRACGTVKLIWQRPGRIIPHEHHPGIVETGVELVHAGDFSSSGTGNKSIVEFTLSVQMSVGVEFLPGAYTNRGIQIQERVNLYLPEVRSDITID